MNELINEMKTFTLLSKKIRIKIFFLVIRHYY